MWTLGDTVIQESLHLLKFATSTTKLLCFHKAVLYGFLEKEAKQSMTSKGNTGAIGELLVKASLSHGSTHTALWEWLDRMALRVQNWGLLRVQRKNWQGAPTGCQSLSC